MGPELDALDLADGKRLVIVSDADGPAAVPVVRQSDGGWRRARPGDGVAEALLAQLDAGSSVHGNFTVRSWAPRTATGERAITVDQTNESVIVGDAAVVKWATHLQEGPHPAPHLIAVLRDAGFRAMPSPWGLVTWQPRDGAETLVASIDEYLPGAVDGWTWAVDLITDAARDRGRRLGPAVAAATEVGAVVAELHAALAGTAAVASAKDAARWHQAALATLDDACALSNSATAALLRERRTGIETEFARFGALAGSRVITAHGDLHVGQVLRCDGRFVVTDFDGNPVLPGPQRVLPVPATLDVAGMTQSLVHAAIVARRYADLDDFALAEVNCAVRQAFLATYVRRLTDLDHAELYDPALLRAFRLQQVLREIVYAARHLPRWMYVPDAALPALLDERTAP